MPQFLITAPDGTKYNVTGPEGSTEQDALAQVQAQHGQSGLHLNPSIAPQVPQGAPRPFAPGEYVDNPNGSWSSEISMTVTHPDLNGGKPTVIPSMWLNNGQPVRARNEDQAVKYAVQSGLKFNSFDTIDHADAFANDREAQWQKVGREGAAQLPPLYSGQSNGANTAAYSNALGLPPIPADVQKNAAINALSADKGAPLNVGNAMSAVGNVGLGMANGVFGIPGDVESLVRWASRKGDAVSQQNALPTTGDINSGNSVLSVFGAPSSPEAATERGVGSFLSPLAAARGIPMLTRGAGAAASAVTNPVTSRMIPADVQAQSLLSRALTRDNISPQNAADTLAQFGGKPAAVMDVGGPATARLARTVNTLPGEGSQAVSTFLAERQADQGGRVIEDIKTHLSNGGDPYILAQDLMAQRSQAADPLYKEAFAANPNISSPVIDRILETPAGKRALADARTMMQNDMKLLGTPDTELTEQARDTGQVTRGGVASGLKLRTLDYVKQALDDQIGVAIRTGENGQARILGGLKNKFVSALDDADATAQAGPNSLKPEGGLYAQARAAYSGPSQSMDALQQGQDFLKLSPAALSDTIGKLGQSDQDFFRIGAARALQNKISGAADNADAVARVFGNKTIRSQIGAVFGPDATTQFAQAMTPEKIGAMTNRFVRGNSTTADKLADIADTGTGAQVAQDAATGFLHGGPAGAVVRPALGYANAKISQFFNGLSPEVRAQLGNLLTQTGPDAIKSLNALGNSAKVASPVLNTNIISPAAIANNPVLRALLLNSQLSRAVVPQSGNQQAQ